MSPGLGIMEVDLNTECSGMASTRQALVTWLGNRRGGEESFHKGDTAMNRRGERRGRDQEGLPEFCFKLLS